MTFLQLIEPFNFIGICFDVLCMFMINKIFKIEYETSLSGLERHHPVISRLFYSSFKQYRLRLA